MSEAPCPNCSSTIRDLWEYGEGVHEIECDACEARLILNVVHTVTYEIKTWPEES